MTLQFPSDAHPVTLSAATLAWVCLACRRRRALLDLEYRVGQVGWMGQAMLLVYGGDGRHGAIDVLDSMPAKMAHADVSRVPNLHLVPHQHLCLQPCHGQVHLVDAQGHGLHHQVQRLLVIWQVAAAEDRGVRLVGQQLADDDAETDLVALRHLLDVAELLLVLGLAEEGPDHLEAHQALPPREERVEVPAAAEVGERHHVWHAVGLLKRREAHTWLLRHHPCLRRQVSPQDVPELRDGATNP
mmetsp:Transcript_74164/g.209459  ORF Transcript_74164/g.209459 Transcript_74164/m.209459 type:complete len:243 (+) Transcript_74164:38-766(+)